MHLNQLYIRHKMLSERERSRRKRGLAPGERPGVEKYLTSPISKAVKSKGTSQEVVADKADVDPSTISRYKSKVRQPSFDSLKKVSKALGTQASTLWPELSV